MADCVIDTKNAEQMLRFLRIIAEKGIEGVHVAVEYIGPEAAIGMLMMQLRRNIQAGRRLMTEAEINSEIKKILREAKILR